MQVPADGQVGSAARILSGTRANCAGGATPWGTWLSCAEIDLGVVWETDPTGAQPGVRRSAMGLFRHEAAAVDPDRRVVYLTEDDTAGFFYLFRPTRWPDLSAGTLEVLSRDTTWVRVPDQGGTPTRTRRQVEVARHFNGGEGAWYSGGSVWSGPVRASCSSPRPAVIGSCACSALETASLRSCSSSVTTARR